METSCWENCTTELAVCFVQTQYLTPHSPPPPPPSWAPLRWVLYAYLLHRSHWQVGLSLSATWLFLGCGGLCVAYFSVNIRAYCLHKHDKRCVNSLSPKDMEPPDSSVTLALSTKLNDVTFRRKESSMKWRHMGESAGNNVTFTGCIFVKFYIGNFADVSRHRFSLKSDKHNRYFIWRHMLPHPLRDKHRKYVTACEILVNTSRTLEPVRPKEHLTV
jgi:hypothetical protein